MCDVPVASEGALRSPAYLPPGRHRELWDGADEHGRALSSGIYFVWLDFDGVVVDTRKAILVQ